MGVHNVKFHNCEFQACPEDRRPIITGGKKKLEERELYTCGSGHNLNDLLCRFVLLSYLTFQFIHLSNTSVLLYVCNWALLIQK